jgi:hypothetical protein
MMNQTPSFAIAYKCGEKVDKLIEIVKRIIATLFAGVCLQVLPHRDNYPCGVIPVGGATAEGAWLL